MTDEQTNQLLEQQNIIIEKLSKNKEKDKWDKLTTLSTFLSSIVIGVLGIYFTTTFKAREVALAEAQVRVSEAQVRTAEAEVVGKLVLSLSGPDEAAKKGALLTISTLSNKDLASKLGVFYASSGTIEALEILFNGAEGENKDILQNSLIEALFNRAISNYTKEQDYDQIIKDCERIFALKSKDELKNKNEGYFLADCYRLFGVGYAVIGKYDLAKDNFVESLKIIPNYNQAYRNLGNFYAYPQNPAHSNDQALEYFDLAVQYGNLTVYLDRGQIYFAKDQLDQAIMNYSKYISSYPRDYKGYFELAKAQKRKGDQKSCYYNLKQAQGLAKTQTDPIVYPNDVIQIDQEIEEINNLTKINNTNNIGQGKVIPQSPSPKKTRQKTRPRHRS